MLYERALALHSHFWNHFSLFRFWLDFPMRRDLHYCNWKEAILKARVFGTSYFTGHLGCFGIIIGRSCLEGCGFDSHCRPGSFLRFNSRPIMYGAVGSLASCGGLGPVDLSSVSARAVGFNCIMTLSKICTYTCAPANQAIHPFGVGKLIPAICRG